MTDDDFVESIADFLLMYDVSPENLPRNQWVKCEFYINLGMESVQFAQPSFTEVLPFDYTEDGRPILRLVK